MTLPFERTRAVIQARAFLLELSQDESLPAEVRRQAWHLLRHYPTRQEVLHAGDMEERLSVDTLFQPMFASSESYQNE